MTPGLTSVVIPHRNQVAYLCDAIDSALAQTADVEVIVVDDGSADDPLPSLKKYERGRRVRVIWQDYGGPAKARNTGLDAARGEFVQFLDADDVLAADKVSKQIKALDGVGWVLSDVRIEDEVRGTRLASEQYRYSDRNLGGWIADQLAVSNFIPVMAPLVRASILTDHQIRFSLTHTPEDWEFWYAVARVARVRYLPEVLATYRKRRTGRHTEKLPNLNPATSGPVILNLGCGTPGSRSWHPIAGAVNLDRSMGWMFEDGLTSYADNSVDAITISHALMYVYEMDWPKVFAEFARVLTPGGVIRITEDHTEHPSSSRRGGWKGSEPAVTLTTPELVIRYLRESGLTASQVDEGTTNYPTPILRQAQHGAEPDVFFVEGMKGKRRGRSAKLKADA